MALCRPKRRENIRAVSLKAGNIDYPSQTDEEETILIGGTRFLAWENFRRSGNVTRNSFIVGRQIQFTNIRHPGLIRIQFHSYSHCHYSVIIHEGDFCLDAMTPPAETTHHAKAAPAMDGTLSTGHPVSASVYPDSKS